ncbi:MAG: heavy metal-binding domain-containing protein [Bacillota bacterium]|jgi:uncharacterized protein YbjQ (UPF0145 family)
MILTTTPSVEGRQVDRYLGIVAGETIMGANVFRDFMAGLSDVFGGRASAYEEKLDEARYVAMQEMAEKARRLGADAVIGIDIDYEVVGGSGSMLMVTAAGTAVKLK